MTLSPICVCIAAFCEATGIHEALYFHADLENLTANDPVMMPKISSRSHAMSAVMSGNPPGGTSIINGKTRILLLRHAGLEDALSHQNGLALARNPGTA